MSKRKPISVDYDLSEIKAGLAELKPSGRPQVEIDFDAVYDRIEELLNTGMSQKDVIAFLVGKKFKVSPAQFNRLRMRVKAYRDGLADSKNGQPGKPS